MEIIDDTVKKLLEKVISEWQRQGYYMAAFMLKHALTEQGSYLNISKDSAISQAIKEMTWYKGLVSQALTKGKSDSLGRFDLSGSFDFRNESKDAGFAFGKANYRIWWQGITSTQSIWTLEITDRYDFEANGSLAEWFDLPGALNGLGYSGQQRNVVVPFNYTIIVQDEGSSV